MNTNKPNIEKYNKEKLLETLGKVIDHTIDLQNISLEYDKNKFGAISRPKPEILAFMSGKGGAGKTTVAIGISHFLSALARNVLLIDFDFVTNGLTYFFRMKDDNTTEQPGIMDYELMKLQAIEQQRNNNNDILEDDHLVYTDEGFCPNLYLMFSEIKMRLYPNSPDKYLTETLSLDILLRDFVNRLVTSAVSREYHYIIFDCAAGKSPYLQYLFEHVDKYIFTCEPDRMSENALSNLLDYYKPVLNDKEKYFLMNKVNATNFSRAREFYAQFRKGLTPLPPILYDSKVSEKLMKNDFTPVSGINDEDWFSVKEFTFFDYQILKTIKILFPDNPKMKFINKKINDAKKHLFENLLNKQKDIIARSVRLLRKLFLNYKDIDSTVNDFKIAYDRKNYLDISQQLDELLELETDVKLDDVENKDLSHQIHKNNAETQTGSG